MSVIATSSGAAAAYVKEGFSNVRLAMFLEIATALGAVAGAHLTSLLPSSALAVIFGCVLLYSAWHSFRTPQRRPGGTLDLLAVRLKLNGTDPGPAGSIAYQVCRLRAGFSQASA